MFMKLKSSRGGNPSAEMNDCAWHEITNRHRCLVVPRLGEANNLIVKPSIAEASCHDVCTINFPVI
jgi:hypothetical protein